MEPKEWAVWFIKKNPDEKISDLITSMRSAAKYGLWCSPSYAETVIDYLKQLDTAPSH